MKPAERSVKYSTVWMQKNCYKIRREKKTHQFHKTGPTELSFDTSNLYKKNTLGLLFLQRFVENWAIPEFIREQTFLRITEDVYKILRYKIQRKKTTHFSKICARELSLHTIHIYKKIHLVYQFWDISLKIEHFLNLFQN